MSQTAFTSTGVGAVAMSVVPFWINGDAAAPEQMGAGHLPRTGDVTNPATGSVVRKVFFADARDVDRAVRAAAVAFPAWSATPPIQRARILGRFRELLEQNQKDMARLVSEEHGKVFLDAMGSVQRGIEVVEFAIGVPHLLKGERSESVGRGVDATRACSRSASARAFRRSIFRRWCRCGCSPSRSHAATRSCSSRREKDPSASVMMAELLKEAGLPDGVFNVLHGDKEAVDALLHHPDVKAISFVGSTPIAKVHLRHGGRATASACRRSAARKITRWSCRMRTSDCAADALIGAAYGSAGERCMAISAVGGCRRDAGDALVERSRRKAQALKVGPGRSAEGMDMGPLVTRAHRDRVRGYVDAGVAEGATLVLDGRALSCADTSRDFSSGRRCSIASRRRCRIYTDEIFGPVLVVLRVEYARRGHRARERESISATARRSLRSRAQRRARLRRRSASGHGGSQRADPRAGGALFVRRLEAVALRRPSCVRTGRREVLHEDESCDDPVA